MKSPHVIQLSRLQAPVIGKGRPYTVDFGIAKPLYKQLLSKCKTRFVESSLFKPPTTNLLVAGLRIKGRFMLLTAFISVYTVVGLSFIPAHHITYADPIIQPKLQPIAMLTMPVVASVQPAETLLYTLSDNLPNAYVWGQCTYGVASRIPIPSDWGNAGEWAFSASNQGFSVSNVPRVGAIAQTSGDSYLGHVGIVTAINDDGTITVWEENYYGLGVTDERITNTLEFPNFIYI